MEFALYDDGLMISKASAVQIKPQMNFGPVNTHVQKNIAYVVKQKDEMFQ